MRNKIFWWVKFVGGIILSVVIAPCVIWLAAVVWKVYKMLFMVAFPHALWPSGDSIGGDLASVALFFSVCGVFLIPVLIGGDKERDETLTEKLCDICGEKIKKDENSFHLAGKGEQKDYCEKCRIRVYYDVSGTLKSGA